MHESFVPTAFSARSESTRDKVAEQYPHCTFHFDYKELINSPDVDGVVVLTPISLNAPVAMEVLKAGKHAFLEKPMANSTEEGKQLIDAEAKSDGHVYILEQAVYSVKLDAIKRTIQSGELGRPICVERAMHVYMSAEDDQTGYGGTSWRQHADFPLGLIYDAGIHDLAQLSELFGAPKSLYARGAKLREEYGEYDQTIVLLDYDRDVSGVYSHSGYLGGMDNYTIIRCEEGSLVKHGDAPWKILYKRGSEKQLELDSSDNDHEAMWKHFSECLARGEPPRYTTTRSLDEFRTFDAIAESLKSGSAAKVSGR